MYWTGDSRMRSLLLAPGATEVKFSAGIRTKGGKSTPWFEPKKLLHKKNSYENIKDPI